MRRPLRSASRHSQRGAIALMITVLLLFALVLGIAYSHRDLLFEQRTSANQYRSTQAFEAAEAGLEWALAQLNHNRRLDAACRPTGDAGATTFRERYLKQDATLIYIPATWNAAGVANALQPSCVRSAAGWVCSCPADGTAELPPPGGATATPAFALRFAAGDKPGVVRALAIGCSHLAAPCTVGAATADATARLEVALALLPGLRSAPAAALTARGAVTTDAALGAHNRDPLSGGAAIHAGGAVAASQARLSSPPGASGAGAIVSDDAALAGSSETQFFASYFGIDPATWISLPTVERVDCRGSCAAELQRAVDAGAALPLIAVDGDLAIDGPVALGSAERPVVIVATGAARLRGAVVLHGVLYAASIAWNDTDGGGALLRGAAISAGSYQGNGAPDLVYDPALLARLRGSSGSFARVNGSWKDF